MPADDNSPSQPGPFDVPTLRELIVLMAQHDLSEIDLQDGPQRVRLRRGPRGITVAPTAMSIPTAMPLQPPPVAHPTAAPAATAPAKPAKTTVAIKSPGVGTFYLSSKPGAEPFVRVGGRVTPTTTVGLLEAMKIFNEVPAECAGVVVEVLVQDKQAVEFGQELFRIDPAG